MLNGGGRLGLRETQNDRRRLGVRSRPWKRDREIKRSDTATARCDRNRLLTAAAMIGNAELILIG